MKRRSKPPPPWFAVACPMTAFLLSDTSDEGAEDGVETPARAKRRQPVAKDASPAPTG